MSTPSLSSSPTQPTGSRSRGSHKPRGGFGKYARARGRGGRGRPAEFVTRLLLEGEAQPDLDDEEAAEKAREERAKYGRRQMESNADRYEEEEVVLGPDGEWLTATGKVS